MAYFISAYATSPSISSWNPVLESQYFQALAENPNVIGIEHPYFLDSNKYPLPWLQENIPDHWSIVITALPFFMDELKKNPYLGLASENEEARKQAVYLMKKMSQYTETLNNFFGRQVVKAIHFHSLPRNDREAKRGSKIALERSLDEIKRINWQGVELNLEHCDAYISNQPPEKGFLLLEEEIHALSTVGDYGLVLNWARSTIEGRSTSEPLKHIKMAKKAGLLKGFFFSGCTDQITSSYGEWKDTHMPPKNFTAGNYLENDSLLGKPEIVESLNNLEKDVYLGIKVYNPDPAKPLEKAIGLNIETIKAISEAVQ
ncbi:MAG: hypothetical protein A3F17_07895 [Gammaproteobacteria bacterium RIFCSPHIGHO2_12_FULL_41_15]|nr:MAG: hypothetical protein A3F17_07895 [Gammaproteobacteria bacterium RIFCSPHIGHO2_12_FULL_41_15]